MTRILTTPLAKPLTRTFTKTIKKNGVRTLACTPLLLAGLMSGLLLTACGGGSSDTASGSGSGGAGSAPTSAADRGLAFAKCMRAHGVPKFPDPGQGGNVIIGGGDVDPKSPEFQKARQACRSLSPEGLGGGAAGGSIDPAKAAAWAQCIRAHGEPKFEDPQINGHVMQIDLGASGIDPRSGTFHAAMSACQGKMPPGANFQITDGGSR